MNAHQPLEGNPYHIVPRLLCLLLFTCFLSDELSADDTVGSKRTATAGAVAKRLSEQPAEIPNAYKAIVTDLIRIARSEDRHRVERTRAIRILGEIHAHEACEWLSQNIAYYDRLETGSMRPLVGFPAAKALSEIGGFAAFYRIQGRLAKPINEMEVRLIAFTIRSMDPEQAAGLARLEIEANAAREYRENQAAKAGRTYEPSLREQNLVEIIKFYKNTDFRKPAEWPSNIAALKHK